MTVAPNSVNITVMQDSDINNINIIPEQANSPKINKNRS